MFKFARCKTKFETHVELRDEGEGVKTKKMNFFEKGYCAMVNVSQRLLRPVYCLLEDVEEKFLIFSRPRRSHLIHLIYLFILFLFILLSSCAHFRTNNIHCLSESRDKHIHNAATHLLVPDRFTA